MESPQAPERNRAVLGRYARVAARAYSAQHAIGSHVSHDGLFARGSDRSTYRAMLGHVQCTHVDAHDDLRRIRALLPHNLVVVALVEFVDDVGLHPRSRAEGKADAERNCEARNIDESERLGPKLRQVLLV